MVHTNSADTTIRVKGKWVSVPTADVNGNKLIVKGKWLKTAIVRGEEMMESELANPEDYIEKLRNDEEHVLKADVFTFTQKLPATQPKYHYPVSWESIAAIRLSSFRDWWENLPQETRKNVRRSQKQGVEVKIGDFTDDLIRGIQEVNDESPFRQGTPNAYYGLSFDDTRDRYGEFVGRCDFICAYFHEELIGFLHLVYRGGVASVLNITTRPSHFVRRPANALVAKAVELCNARGLSHITYGLYNYGNKRTSSLREFKIRNGFREVLVPRYFVPLTPWGWFCVKANLHHGLIGILPNFVITAGVRARYLWYAQRFHKPV